MPPAAMHAALAALEREREDLLAETAKRASKPSDRAKRLLTRLPEIVAKYRELMAQGVKVLTDPAGVAEASEALRSLLVDGRLVLAPNAAHDGVEGTAHFKELGDHVLEMAGCVRRVGAIKAEQKANEIKKNVLSDT